MVSFFGGQRPGVLADDSYETRGVRINVFDEAHKMFNIVDDCHSCFS